MHTLTVDAVSTAWQVWSHVAKFQPITAPACSTTEASGSTAASSTKACAGGLSHLYAMCRNQLNVCLELAGKSVKKVRTREGCQEFWLEAHGNMLVSSWK